MSIRLIGDVGALTGLFDHSKGQTIENINDPYTIRSTINTGYYLESPPIEVFDVKEKLVRPKGYPWMAWFMKTGDLP